MHCVPIVTLLLLQVRASIQRALGRPLPLEEIGTLTIGGLKALAAEAGGGSKQPPKKAEATPAAGLPAQKSLKAKQSEAGTKEEANKPSRVEVVAAASSPGTPDRVRSAAEHHLVFGMKVTGTECCGSIWHQSTQHVGHLSTVPIDIHAVSRTHCRGKPFERDPGTCTECLGVGRESTGWPRV